MQNHEILQDHEVLQRIVKVITNRCLIMFVIILALFYVLLARLFFLQIVTGQSYRDTPNVTDSKEVALPASRGNIYDRLGRPLAINKSAYGIKMDASTVKIDADNLYDFIKLMESKGETIVDTFPFTKQKPYKFDFTGTGWTQKLWKEGMFDKDNADDMNLTAEQAFQKLREKFKVNPDLPDSEARKILNLCNMLYLKRYSAWEPITVAYDVKPETLSIIEEETVKYNGFSADVQSLRNYPEGKYFSQIIGYTGYEDSVQVGKNGIESVYESRLHGINGKAFAEIITSSKKFLRILPEKEIPAVSGDNIYLTLDRDLQVAAYNILEDMLRDTLINELQGLGNIKNPITVKQFFSSLVKGVSIDIDSVMSAPAGSPSEHLKNYALSKINSPDLQNPDIRKQIRQAFADAIQEDQASPGEILRIMLEQNIISGGAQLSGDLENNRVSVMGVVLDKLKNGEITPQMTGLDPCTGSVVVSDVKNGNVLAAVSYPSYDTNRFVNKLDYNYFISTFEDPLSPSYNRAFKEPRAPGSTIKMISAITALECGSITPVSTIFDGSVFTAAGQPYLRCWSPVSHGAINVSRALGVSCNFFFCEAIYRLGNDKAGNKLNSISDLDHYLTEFGLNKTTGVEIGEEAPMMPSPELKESLFPDAPVYDREWHDGNTVQTAIGQGFSNYTAADMNRYILTLATRGQRYQLHLVDSVRGAGGQLIEKTRPNMEAALTDISDSTWDAVYKGMLWVTEGQNGTGVNTFRGFPVRVAGKTGTAQQVPTRNDHSSFGGFAPYDDPQIAIYVSVPFGDTKAMPALASQVALRVMSEYFGLDSEPQYPDAENRLIK